MIKKQIQLEYIIDKIMEKTEAEIDEEFLQEYIKLSTKYRRDFYIQSGERPQITPIKLREDITPNAI